MRKAPTFQGLAASSQDASKMLAKIKSTDTQGEKLLRSALWRLGLRFRKNVRDLPGRPDVVFPREKVVVFCDGDFWHGRKWHSDKRRLMAGPNARYWVAKIQANRERDKRHAKDLMKQGWSVMRFWDSEVKSDPSRAAHTVVELITFKRRKKRLEGATSKCTDL
jgi:DNA mismatch endonuclease (patch repair protein)